jgi:hypothetical protein
VFVNKQLEGMHNAVFRAEKNPGKPPFLLFTACLTPPAITERLVSGLSAFP